MIVIINRKAVECCARCHKRSYATEEQAAAMLRHCQMKGREEQRYYFCAHSNSYHLTKQAKNAA